MAAASLALPQATRFHAHGPAHGALGSAEPLGVCAVTCFVVGRESYAFVLLYVLCGCELERAEPAVPVKPATFEQRLALAQRTAPSGFTVVGQRPFIVIGNHSQAIMRDVATRIVGPTVRLLKKDFFARDPQVTEVWLMRDARSYREFVRRKLGRDPSTPYGFYLPALQRMVLNHATGSGTLIHELVHPFVGANLPNCPAWFNEGLASLYEMSTAHEDHLVGLLNWRLPPFRQRILSGEARSLRWMIHASIDDFGEDETGDAYAAARYLLYYLQEHELLIPFYRRFHARIGQDRSGVQTLLETLGERDVEAFERKWHAWLLDLGAQDEWIWPRVRKVDSSKATALFLR